MHHGKTTCIGSSIVRFLASISLPTLASGAKDFDLRRALERPGHSNGGRRCLRDVVRAVYEGDATLAWVKGGLP